MDTEAPGTVVFEAPSLTLLLSSPKRRPKDLHIRGCHTVAPPHISGPASSLGIFSGSGTSQLTSRTRPLAQLPVSLLSVHKLADVLAGQGAALEALAAVPAVEEVLA